MCPATTICIFVWNAQSLVNKIDEVIQFLSDNQVAIACISETWFSEEGNITTFAIKEAGYEIDHTYRSKRGCGVAILWKSNIKVKCNLKTKDYSSFEYKNILLEGTVQINLIYIYRHWEFPISQFLDELDVFLSYQMTKGDTVVLTGDFNFHYEKSNSNNDKLAVLTSSYGLSQFVVGSTHKLGHTLDLIFANKHEFDLPSVKSIDIDMSDHYPILFNLPCYNNTAKPSAKTLKCRNIKSIDRPVFSQNLRNSIDCKLQCVSGDINFCEHYKIFSECAVSELDKLAPIKTISTSNTTQPSWMDAEYKQERILRRRLERSWKASRLPHDKTLYKLQRKKCAQLSTTKRKQYFSDLIQKSEGDQQALFKIVSTVMDKRKMSGILPVYSNSVTLANKFNNFYSNKVLQIREKIKPSNLVNDFRKPFSGMPMESFTPTNVDELRKLIRDLGIKTCSQDPIPGSLLKDIIEDLLPYYCDLVNKSLRTGSVEGVKDSVIIPLLKKSGLDPDNLKNYRPVTNEAFVSKLSEKVVSVRLFDHMTLNDLHSRYQHAYKKFHSTETLLLKLNNDINIGFENDLVTVMLLVDLTAAFDTVDIDKMLDILESDIGIRGTALLWFKSFLIGRMQSVKIDDSLSDTIPVLHGVPQGSVLGPVLFNIYSSSLSPVINNFGFDTSGYADDNNAYTSFSLAFQYQVIAKQLPDLVNQINYWMNLYFLKMNPDKTEIILFLPQHLSSVHTINGCFLPDGTCKRFSDSVKNLGFLMDKHLTMNTHVNSTVSHCYKLLSDIGKIRNILSDKHTEMLVHAVISTRMDYCNSLLYGINKTTLNKYQKVQNAAARLISKRRKFQSVSDVLVKLHWLHIEQRIIFKLLLFVYKSVNNMAPDCVVDMIAIKDVDRRLLHLKDYQTVHARKSFSYIAPRLWNNLTDEIRLSPNILNFKKQTKHLLFNNFNKYMKLVFKYNN